MCFGRSFLLLLSPYVHQQVHTRKLGYLATTSGKEQLAVRKEQLAVGKEQLTVEERAAQSQGRT